MKAGLLIKNWALRNKQMGFTGSLRPPRPSREDPDLAKGTSIEFAAGSSHLIREIKGRGG